MRKAPEPEEQDEEDVEEETAEEPAKKRGRPAARAAAVVTSTRLSASKPTRGRPKSTTATVSILPTMIPREIPPSNN